MNSALFSRIGMSRFFTLLPPILDEMRGRPANSLIHMRIKNQAQYLLRKGVSVVFNELRKTCCPPIAAVNEESKMKMSQLKLIPIAVSMLMLGVSGSASAGSYALAANNIQDFTIVSTNLTFAPISIDTSSASAILNGAGAGPTGGVGTSDAPIAIAPGSTLTPAQQVNNSAFPANAAIIPVGMTPGSNYSYADALISHAVPGNPPFDAEVIAESHLSTTGSASGTATNSSATGFTAFFTAGTGATLDFAFLADPLIRTFLQPITGLFAQGTLSASLTITCVSTAGCGNSAVNQVAFSWAPNGVSQGAGGVTGAVGGLEIADQESLNTSLTNFQPGGLKEFSGTAAFSSFEARTGILGAGDYTLTLAMTATDGTLKVVPEPGSIALFGLGLSALGFAARRRRNASV